MKVIEKIKKLLAKAEGTTHPEEADLFMSKVHELLEMHGLSLQDLNTINTGDPVIHSADAGYYYQAESAFKSLAGALARYYGCEAIHCRDGSKIDVDVFGRTSACITFELMFPYVKKRVRKLANDAYKEGMYMSKSRAQRAIANALTVRIYKMIPPKPKVSEKNALVPYDDIQALIEKTYDVKTGRRTSLKFGSYAEELANQVNINKQTSAGKAERITHAS